MYLGRAHRKILPTPIGIISPFGGSVLDMPIDYLPCDGTPVNRLAFPELFIAIGITWGNGDGSTTFNLPDLRARAPSGINDGSLPAGPAGGGLSSRSPGETVGSENHSHSVNSHDHTISANFVPGHTHGGTTNNAIGVAEAIADANHWGNDGTRHRHNHTFTTGPDAGHSHSGSTSSVGGGTNSGSNIAPAAFMLYMIKAI